MSDYPQREREANVKIKAGLREQEIHKSGTSWRGYIAFESIVNVYKRGYTIIHVCMFVYGHTRALSIHSVYAYTQLEAPRYRERERLGKPNSCGSRARSE